MDNSIIDKYHIVFIGHQRYYVEDLSKKDYLLENCTPFSLDLCGKNFLCGSWKQLLLDVVTHLLKNKPEMRDILLDYKMPWSGKKAFSNTKDKCLEPVGAGIYLLCNFTALHACWFLQEILKLFEIDPKSCNFIIRRSPGGEPAECRDYFREQTKASFKYYFVNLLKNSEERADKVIRNIEKLNKYLAKVSASYDDFLLFDNYQMFSNYKSKFLDYLATIPAIDEKNFNIADKYLNYLGEFYHEARH